MLETAAFLALRRKTNGIYYYTTPAGSEVDFYLPETRQLIQVAQHLDSPATREREVRALLDAMQTLNVQESLILADANATPIQENGITIHIRSLVEWLLDG